MVYDPSCTVYPEGLSQLREPGAHCQGLPHVFTYMRLVWVQGAQRALLSPSYHLRPVEEAGACGSGKKRRGAKASFDCLIPKGDLFWGNPQGVR